MGRKAFNLKDFGFGNKDYRLKKLCISESAIYIPQSHGGWVAEVGVISYLTSHFALTILEAFCAPRPSRL
jgi:hypothetical protein